MPINKKSIISVFNDRLTLMQWLATVDKALQEGTLEGVDIKKKGNATIAFVFTFADGTTLETPYIILQQGESITDVKLENGKLYVTLSNGDIIEAGDIKGISSMAFDASRHLIVTYDDNTTQDLGLIKGISSMTFDNSRHLIVTYDDNTTQDLGLIKGISSIALNAQKHLIVTYDNGTTADLGLIKGISSIAFDASRHLIVTYDNGTTADLGLIKGLSSFSLDENYHLHVTYDNGTTEDLGPVISGTIDFTTLDLVAKTLKQSQANYSKTFNFSTSGSLTVSNVYNRFMQIGNVLYIIANLVLTNNTANPVTISANQQLVYCGTDIANSVGELIYDIDGTKVSESALESNTLITAFSAKISNSKIRNGDIVEGLAIFANRGGVGNCEVDIYTKEAITVEAGESIYVFTRAPLTLL